MANKDNYSQDNYDHKLLVDTLLQFPLGYVA